MAGDRANRRVKTATQPGGLSDPQDTQPIQGGCGLSPTIATASPLSARRGAWHQPEERLTPPTEQKSQQRRHRQGYHDRAGVRGGGAHVLTHRTHQTALSTGDCGHRSRHVRRQRHRLSGAITSGLSPRASPTCQPIPAPSHPPRRRRTTRSTSTPPTSRTPAASSGRPTQRRTRTCSEGIRRATPAVEPSHRLCTAEPVHRPLTGAQSPTILATLRMVLKRGTARPQRCHSGASP